MMQVDKRTVSDKHRNRNLRKPKVGIKPERIEENRSRDKYPLNNC